MVSLKDYYTSPSLFGLLGIVAVSSNVWTGVRAQDDGKNIGIYFKMAFLYLTIVIGYDDGSDDGSDDGADDGTDDGSDDGTDDGGEDGEGDDTATTTTTYDDGQWTSGKIQPPHTNCHVQVIYSKYYF